MAPMRLVALRGRILGVEHETGVNVTFIQTSVIQPSWTLPEEKRFCSSCGFEQYSLNDHLRHVARSAEAQAQRYRVGFYLAHRWKSTGRAGSSYAPRRVSSVFW